MRDLMSRSWLRLSLFVLVENRLVVRLIVTKMESFKFCRDRPPRWI